MKSNFSVIEARLNDFIRKFYSNRIILGLLLFFLIFCLTIFVLFLTEGFVFMQPIVKTILFYFALFLFSSVFVFFILIPVLKVLKLIPFLTFEEASKIISNYFKDSNDLLINILQLEKSDDKKNDFLIAAINQKIDKISPWNFTNAIDFKSTFKFLTFSGGVLLIVLLFSFLFSNRIKQGAERFINYSTYYEKENPYTVALLKDTLHCFYGEDFEVKLQILGPNFLKDVYLFNDDFSVRMNEDSSGFYSYTLKNISSDINFRVKYLNYSTSDYLVKVFSKPQILNSTIKVIPPSYTKISSEEFDNTGDLTVPFGSKIQWNYNISNCNSFIFFIDSSKVDFLKESNSITIEKIAKKSFDYNYSLYGENSYNQSSDMFHVNLIPDYYPSIIVESMIDSTSSNSMFFLGHISDDYGFHSLDFVYYDTEKPNDLKREKIDFNESLSQDFYFYFDFSNLSRSVSYYFEVRDNDNISGFKSSKSTLNVYSKISDKEKQQRIESLQSSMSDKVDRAQQLLRELNNDLNDFQKSVAANNNLSEWEKKLKIDNLTQKQNKLQQLLKEISEDNQFKNALENQLSFEQSQDLAEKQMQLQQLWDQLMTDDIKTLMEKIAELSKQLSEKDFRNNISDMKFDYNQISEQLDRNNTLMKMFNIQNKLHNVSRELRDLSSQMKNLEEKLSEEGKKLSEETKDNLKKELENISKLFNEKQKDYNNLKNQNESLDENRLDIPDMDEKFSEISQQLDSELKELEKSVQELNKKSDNKDSDSNNSNNSNNSKDSDKNDSNVNQSSKTNREKLQKQMEDTSEQMEDLSDEMMGLQQNNQQQKNQENINDIRQILDNLLSLSFAQEKSLNILKSGSRINSETISTQISIRKDFALVQDSIYALAKREPSIGHSVYEKINEINSYFSRIEDGLNENKRSSVAILQQNTLKDINDLSLLFSEVQDQMMNQQMQSSSSSSEQQSSTNSSKNRKQMQEREQNMQQLKNGQQSLKETLEKIFQQLQKGNNPSNQKLVESLKQMEMMQYQLQQMQNGQGNTPKQQQLLNEMNQILENSKRDIINRNINKSLIDRQNTMFNKLLELENAEKEQDYDEKRESKQSTDLQNKNNNELKFNFKKFSGKEFLNQPVLNLNLFYQNKYSEYLQNIE